MPEPRGAARAPQRNTSQQDRPHVSTGNPGATSNARATRSSVGAPGATPASTTAATLAPQTPNACTRRHAPLLTAHGSRRHARTTPGPSSTPNATEQRRYPRSSM
ncbi:hypothetical protein DXG01_001302, partial [Tephrocybe rancida]